MDAAKTLIRLDPDREIIHTDPDIYTGLVSAVKLIKQFTNGHLVEVSWDTHNIQEGTWKKRTVAQQIEMKVKITINLKEEQK